MSEKSVYKEKMKAYNEYAKTCNVSRAVENHESTGTFGRDLESRLRYILGNYRAKNLVSNRIGNDTTKKVNGHIVKFEIKQRCSTIGDYRKGYDNFPLLNSNYVLYMMKYSPDMTEQEIIDNTFVIPSGEFLTILNSLNLIRNNTKRLEYQIQVFYTSKKKTSAFYNALSVYPTVASLI